PLGGHRKVGEGDQVRGHQGGVRPSATGFRISPSRDCEEVYRCAKARSLRLRYAVCSRFRKVRARLMVRAFSSGGSFQGNTAISAFGPREATAIEASSGCASTSSGSTSIDVWHDFAKSRDTLYTKSGRTREGLCRYFSMVSIDTSGRRSRSSLAQTVLPASYM